MDVVEVSPPYDQAETTSMLANRVVLEAISALALKRLSGGRVRFERQRADASGEPASAASAPPTTYPAGG
jgi:agmatinase